VSSDALEASLAALGVRIAERPRWRHAIRDALAGAQLDHARHVGRTTRSAAIRRANELRRLADKATEGDVALLAAAIGDGLAVDALLDELMGHPDRGEPQHWCARAFAGAEPADAATRASTLYFVLLDACRFATPTARRRRSVKFFATLALAFTFARITGRTPTYATSYGGERGGEFVDFVLAVDAAFKIDGGDAGFDRTVADVLRIGRIEIANVAAERAYVPAPFGSPAFIAAE